MGESANSQQTDLDRASVWKATCMDIRMPMMSDVGQRKSAENELILTLHVESKNDGKAYERKGFRMRDNAKSKIMDPDQYGQVNANLNEKH